MNISEYLRGLPDAELVKQLDEFSAEEEPGWVSGTVTITPYGSLTRTLIEREISRRVLEA
jgi:hypothetical protein